MVAPALKSAHVTFIARIGTGALGKVRRAAFSAQNPHKGERAEMMASTVAVVESRKAFRGRDGRRQGVMVWIG